MGIEFIQKKGGTIRKSWNRGVRRLAAPDLFTNHPECTTRSVLVDVAPGARIKPKEQFVVQCVGERLVAYDRDMTPVATTEKPPADLFAAIRDTGGCAVAEAGKLHELSGMLELRIKE